MNRFRFKKHESKIALGLWKNNNRRATSCNYFASENELLVTENKLNYDARFDSKVVMLATKAISWH
jgi:hypothetical protein